VTLLLILLKIYLPKNAYYVLNTWRKKKKKKNSFEENILQKKLLKYDISIHIRICLVFSLEQFIVYTTGNIAATVV